MKPFKTPKSDLIEINKKLKSFFYGTLKKSNIEFIHSVQIIEKLDELILEMEWEKK